MVRLSRFLKPYILSLIIIFTLLFVQAMTDLELPSYMSNIVNVGIQQNGISDPIPQILRQSTLDHLVLLMPESDSAGLRDGLEKLDKAEMTADAYTAAVAQYPLLADEILWSVKTGHVFSESVRSATARALFLEQAITAMGGTGAIPGLPAGADLFQVLGQLPAEQRQGILDQAAEKTAGFSESMIRQAAIGQVVKEYQVIGFDVERLQTRHILRTGGLMLLIALLGAACSVLVGYLASRVAAGLSRTLRLAVFSKVEHFSSVEFDTFSTASLITRSTNDIQQIQMTVGMMLRIIFFAPILGIGGIIKVVNTNVSMGWIIALAVSVLLLMIVVMFKVAMPRFKIIQKMVDRLNLVTRELLSGLMVIRAFNTQKRQEEKFDDANRDLTRISLFISRVMALLMPLMMFIMNAVMILIIWVGAKRIDQGSMQVGDIMAFMQYTMQIIMAFLMVSMTFIMLPRASVSAQRIADVLFLDLKITDPTEPLPFRAEAQGTVIFDQVTFRYPGADDDVLHQISFTARPGETTAFIGSTGSGKSTLVNLIPRFYDVAGGRVLVDGVDVRQVRQHDLRQRIGYVAQKGVLFSGSIADNIRYGRPDAESDELRAAAETAQAIDFIDQGEQGFEMPIAQGGANISGGQKQRLSIARALVKNPEIYIFDDTFSALDYKTDAALRQALYRKTAEATVIVVAQRINTIRHADQIIVLDEGRIVGSGTHEELLASCPVYLEIASSQLTEEELAL